jgi:hypothetical protein
MVWLCPGRIAARDMVRCRVLSELMVDVGWEARKRRDITCGVRFGLGVRVGFRACSRAVMKKTE